MQQSQKEWSTLVFKKTGGSSPEQSDLALNLKNVYWAVDGVRTLSEIAEEGMYELEDLVAMVAQLAKMGLVTRTGEQDYIEQATFQYISELLADQLGPMGDMVLEDAVQGLGYEKGNFPKNLLLKLLDALALEMEDADKASKFKQMVIKEASGG